MADEPKTVSAGGWVIVLGEFFERPASEEAAKDRIYNALRVWAHIRAVREGSVAVECAVSFTPLEVGVSIISGHTDLSLNEASVYAREIAVTMQSMLSPAFVQVYLDGKQIHNLTRQEMRAPPNVRLN